MLRFIGVIRRDVPLSSEKGVAATAEDGRRSHAKRTIPGGKCKKKKRKETKCSNNDDGNNNNNNNDN